MSAEVTLDPESGRSPTGDTRPEPPVHRFYEARLARHRATGEPVQALCGYVLRKALGNPPERQAQAPQCRACSKIELELMWARS